MFHLYAFLLTTILGFGTVIYCMRVLRLELFAVVGGSLLRVVFFIWAGFIYWLLPWTTPFAWLRLGFLSLLCLELRSLCWAPVLAPFLSTRFAEFFLSRGETRFGWVLWFVMISYSWEFFYAVSLFGVVSFAFSLRVLGRVFWLRFGRLFVV